MQKIEQPEQGTPDEVRCTKGGGGTAAWAGGAPVWFHAFESRSAARLALPVDGGGGSLLALGGPPVVLLSAGAIAAASDPASSQSPYIFRATMQRKLGIGGQW